ncbi:LicD family protein [Candidatus Saccharibacteria bacterium]|nr:LicD family protein [Candidatus Saccharibacteria bacterium]
MDNFQDNTSRQTGDISFAEQKRILLEMLKYFDGVCRKNGIKYSLIGGSLIGAVRHHGFIPWDDDIDIVLMPEEYRKLLSIFKNNEDRYQLMTPYSSKTYRYPFSKLVDTNTTLEEVGYKNIDGYGIYLDVLSYYYLSNTGLKRKIQCTRQKILKKCFALIALDPNNEKKLFKRVLLHSLNIFPVGAIKRMYAWCCRGDKPTKYIVVNWPCYKMNKEVQLTKNAREYIDVEFEDMKAMVFKKYDEILRTTFGDYMKLPPKEERVSAHKIKARWKELPNEKGYYETK